MQRRKIRLTTIGPLVISVILLVVFSIIFAISARAGSANIQEGLDAISLPILTTTSKLLFNPLYNLDVTSINGILDPYVDGTTVVYAAVYDANGAQVVEINKKWAPDSALSRELSTQALSQPEIVKREVSNYLVLTKSIAVSSTQIGTVEIVFDQAPLQASLGKAQATISATLVIALIVITFLFFILFQYAVRPLNRLALVAQDISRGNLSAEIPVEGTEEISFLASAFVALLGTVRNTIATLEQRVADRTKALATSSEVSRRLSTIFDQKQLVTEVVEQVQSSFNYYHAHIYLLNGAGDELVLAGGTGDAGQTLLARGHKILKGKGLVGRAAETNAPVLVPDTSKNPDWLPNPLLPETKSEVAVPISIGDQALGVLDVQHNIADGLQQDDANLLLSIADQVAIALRNIRQYENSQKIAADMGVVANVGIATSTITDATLLLQEVVDLSKKSFKLYHAHIYLLNETGDALELTSGAGEVGRQMVSEKRSIPLDSEQSLVARAARGHEGVVVNDVTAAPDFLPNPLLPDTRSEMAVPMIVAGKVIGVLDVQSETVNRFTDVDVSIQTTLASQVAVALQNARSFSQTQRQAERETAVNLITQRIQSTTTIEGALQMAARELGHALGQKPTLVTLNQNNGTSGDGKSN